jgi:MFS family permease
MNDKSLINRDRLKTPRAAATAGIIFSVLLMTSLVLIRSTVPYDPFENGSWLTTNAKKVSFALSLIPFSGVAFLWFMGVLRDRFGEYEDRFFATVFIGSGFLFLVMLFTSAAFAGSIILVFGNTPAGLLNNQVFTFGRAAMYTIANIYAIKMASVFMISATSMAHRLNAFPRWVSLFSYGLALILILNLFFMEWLIIVFPLWVLLISATILVENLLKKKVTEKEPVS